MIYFVLYYLLGNAACILIARIRYGFVTVGDALLFLTIGWIFGLIALLIIGAMKIDFNRRIKFLSKK